MPQRKLASFGIDMPGGAYADANGNDISDRRVRRAVIDITQPKVFLADLTEAPIQMQGKIVRVNLFRRDAGWRWELIPQGLDDLPQLVSVETNGRHFYCLRADFVGGLTLSRYPTKTSEPRLRPTARGGVNPYNRVGIIMLRGRPHPVWGNLIVFGGPV